MLLSWAKIWDGASLGGGSNGYLSAIALELIRRGHDVVSLCGGTSYEPDGSDGSPAPCHILRHADWEGIRVFEVVNSPVLAPSIAQFPDPVGEISAPELELLVGELFWRLRPDVLHIHNLEGFSIGCVDAAAAVDPPPRIIFSLHTYHPICPQVFLMQGHRRPCLSFDNGHHCSGCIPTLDPRETRRYRAGDPSRQPTRIVDVSDPRDLTAPLAANEPDRRGRGPSADRDPRRRIPSADDTPARSWTTLDNVAHPEPPSDRAPNDYARRRAAMIAMLNRCDRVLAVSQFVRDKFHAMGLDPDVTSILYIGSRMSELAAATPARSSPPADAEADGTPIRVAFLGFNLWHKGLPLLADALQLSDRETLSRIHLSVFAGGGYGLRELFAPVEPMLAGLTLQNGYEYGEIPDLLEGIDLGLVTSVWWDNAPQTVMEFLACGIPVLGAALGGIPDFIEHGHNGFLYRGNDPHDLARHLATIARDRTLLERVRRNVSPPEGIPEHVVELEAIYAGRGAGEGADPRRLTSR